MTKPPLTARTCPVTNLARSDSAKSTTPGPWPAGDGRTEPGCASRSGRRGWAPGRRTCCQRVEPRSPSRAGRRTRRRARSPSSRTRCRIDGRRTGTGHAHRRAVPRTDRSPERKCSTTRFEVSLPAENRTISSRRACHRHRARLANGRRLRAPAESTGAGGCVSTTRNSRAIAQRASLFLRSGRVHFSSGSGHVPAGRRVRGPLTLHHDMPR